MKKAVCGITRTYLVWLLLVMSAPGLLAQPEGPGTRTIQVGIDIDNNPNTGCDFFLADGSQITGIERILELTIQPGNTPLVIPQFLRLCTQGSFGSGLAGQLEAAVGVNNGTAGSDVVEISVPLTFLGVTDEIRLVFQTFSDTGEYDLLLNEAGTNILYQFARQIPVLPQWMLPIFLLLLVGTAIWIMRRNKRLGRAGLVSLLFAGLTLSAITGFFLVDGQVGDWNASPILATDATGDAGGDIALDMVAAFAGDTVSHLVLRLDIVELQNQPPVADDVAANTLEEMSVVVGLSGNDPDGDPLTFTIDSAPANGSLSAITPLTATTAQITYTPNPDFFGIDSFTYRSNDLQGTSAPATATITVDPVNDAPIFTAGPDIVVIKDLGGQSVPGWATAIAAGPPNEASQTVNFIVSNNNNALFSTQPAISAAGTLTFTTTADTSGTATVTVQLMDDGGVANGGVDISAAIMFQISVTAVNDPPSFTAGSDQMTLEDSGMQTVNGWATAMSAGPPDEAGQMLTFNVTGNTSPGLFSVAPAVDAVSGDLTYTPAADAVGSAMITLELMDDGGIANGGVDTSPPQTFTITITPVNDEPSFTAGPDVVVIKDLGPQTIPGWATALAAGPPDEAGQALNFIVSNDNNALFSTQPAISAAGTLTFATAPDANGATTVTVQLMDDGGTANGGVDISAAIMFQISVTAVNDPPSFTAGPDQMALEDGGMQTVNGWATAISAGPPDEAGQMLTFNVTGNTSPGLFSVAPAVDAVSGDLTYTPAADANGMAMITLDLMDNGGTANGGIDTSPPQTFTITLTSVNDAPSFTAGPDDSVIENSGPRTVNPWATMLSPGPADESGQTLSFNITANSDPGLFSAGPAIDAAGVLTYTPAANVGGTAMITVEIMDNGGTANGGVDTSAGQTFMITVLGINDEPSFTAGPDQMADEDAGAQTVSAWATSISAGPPDEAGQVLTFFVSNDNNPLFSVQPAIDATSGDLTFTSAPDAFGMATVSVFLMDDGGTSNGGDDTSPTVMFTITINPVNDPPTANPDMDYATVGNVFLTVDRAAPAGIEHLVSLEANVLSNDTDSDGPALQVTSTGVSATMLGGSVDMNANGQFHYTPPAGVRGMVDTFTYTVTDNHPMTPLMAMGTVSIAISNELVWFIDDDEPAGGTGTSARPFDTLTAFNGTATDQVGDVIFIFEDALGPMDGGITLDQDQRLIGESEGLMVTHPENAVLTALVAPGNMPQINHTAGDGVSVADATGVIIRGIDIAGSDNAVQVTTSGAGSAGLTFTNSVIRAAGSEGLRASHAGSGAMNLSLTSIPIVAVGNAVDIRTTATGGAVNLVLNNNNTGIRSTGGSGVVIDGSLGGSILISGFSGNSIHQDTPGTGISVNTATFDVNPGLPLEPLLAGDTRIGIMGDGVGASGMVLNTVTGDLRFSDLDIFTSSGAGLSVTGTGLFDMNVGGFSLTSTSGDIVATGGPAVDIDPTTLAMVLNSLSSSNSANRGIVLDTVGGTFSATSVTVTQPTNAGILVQNSPGLNANFGTTTVTGSGVGGGAVGEGINLTNNPGGIFAFSGPAITTDNGAGLIADNSGTLNVTMTGSVAAVGGSAVVLNNTAIGAGLTFTTITANNSGAGNEGIDIDGISGGPFQVTGTTTINHGVSGGTGIDINGSSPTFTFATVDIDNPGGAGISLVNNTAAINFAMGSDITGATGTAFNADGGNAAIGYPGTINNAAGIAVRVANRTGGAVTFGGAIVDNGASNAGILLDNNDAGSVSFNGTVDITTSTGNGVGFQNSQGGTVTFADLDIDNAAANQRGIFATNNTGGTLTISTGTASAGTASAVDIDNTNLVINLRRIDSSGGASPGLDLNTTTGSFRVAGDESRTQNTSGGAILNKTGSGVVLSSATNITLQSMDIDGHGIHGMSANLVSALNLHGCRVRNNGNAGGEEGLFLRDLGQTCLFTDTLVEGNAENGLDLENSTVNLIRLTIDNCSFRNHNGAFGTHGIRTRSLGSVSMNLIVENGTDFQNNLSRGFIHTSSGTSTTSITVRDCEFTSNRVSVDFGSDDAGNLNFNVLDNLNMNGQVTQAIFIVSGSASTGGLIQGRIQGNTIGTGGAGSGASMGEGIAIDLRGQTRGIIDISGNTVNNIGGSGVGGAAIQAQARLGTGGLDVTINNNNVSNLRNFVAAVRLRANDANTVCANVLDNTSTGGGTNLGGGAGSLGGAFEVIINDASAMVAATAVRLQGFNTNPTMTWTGNGNTGTPVSWLQDGGILGAPAANCSVPTNPVPP